MAYLLTMKRPKPVPGRTRVFRVNPWPDLEPFFGRQPVFGFPVVGGLIVRDFEDAKAIVESPEGQGIHLVMEAIGSPEVADGLEGRLISLSEWAGIKEPYDAIMEFASSVEGWKEAGEGWTLMLDAWQEDGSFAAHAVLDSDPKAGRVDIHIPPLRLPHGFPK